METFESAWAWAFLSAKYGVLYFSKVAEALVYSQEPCWIYSFQNSPVNTALPDSENGGITHSQPPGHMCPSCVPVSDTHGAPSQGEPSVPKGISPSNMGLFPLLCFTLWSLCHKKGCVVQGNGVGSSKDDSLTWLFKNHASCAIKVRMYSL